MCACLGFHSEAHASLQSFTTELEHHSPVEMGKAGVSPHLLGLKELSQDPRYL